MFEHLHCSHQLLAWRVLHTWQLPELTCAWSVVAMRQRKRRHLPGHYCFHLLTSLLSLPHQKQVARTNSLPKLFQQLQVLRHWLALQHWPKQQTGLSEICFLGRQLWC